MPKNVWPLIAPYAAEQHGLVMRDQLVKAGLSEQAVDYRIAVRLLEVVHPTVYRVPGAPATWEQSLLAAQLAAGEPSFVSHLAAGMWWKLEGVVAEQPHILLPHQRRVDLVGVVIHRTRRLLDEEVTVRQGIRLTSPARTLVDLAGLLSRSMLELALDDALRRRIVTLDQIRRCLDSRGPNGVRGWGKLDRLVRERIGTEPTGSGKETTFRRGLIRRGLPLPVAQYRIVDGSGRFIARPDFAYPELNLAIEIDGGGHATLSQRRSDARRQNRLVIAGWSPLLFPETDRAGQKEAFDTIEAAFAAFGEPDPKKSRAGIPKRREGRPS